MKLFIWKSVVSLAQCDNGLAFALAKSKEEAVELIVEKYLRDQFIGEAEFLRYRLDKITGIEVLDPINPDQDLSKLRNQIIERAKEREKGSPSMQRMQEYLDNDESDAKNLRDELERTEPEIYETSVGFWRYGSA